MDMPIFTDEAIYVHWAQVAKADASARFISLTDGKQPSFVWLTMIAMKFFSDPLVAGRVVSVLAGFAALPGLFLLSYALFKEKRIAWVSVFLYTIFPMALVYDRLALYESLLGAISVWGLFFVVMLVKTLRLDVAIFLGMTVGLGLLTKTSALFTLYLLPLSLLLAKWKKKDIWKNSRKWIGLVVVVAVLANVYSLLLKLSPLSFMIGGKNALFVYHLSELLPYRAFDSWIGNLVILFDWLITYTTWPLIILVPASFLLARGRTREKLLLLVWFAVPFILLALFGRILHPRLFFFMTLSLLPLIAVSLVSLESHIKNKAALGICCFLFIAMALRSDFYILTNFANAPVPEADLEQYSNDWPAGGGIREVIAFINNESEKQPVIFVTEGIYGSLPTTAAQIYLEKNDRVRRISFEPVPAEIPQEFLEQAKTIPVYLLLNQAQSPPPWPLTLVARYQKGRGIVYASLYKVNPK